MYSIDFRRKVLSVQNEEKLKNYEVATRFKIAISTLIDWKKNIYPKKRKGNNCKLDMELLKQDVIDNPDSYLYERACRFNVSNVCILQALRRLGVSYKKNSKTPKSRRRIAEIAYKKDKWL